MEQNKGPRLVRGRSSDFIIRIADFKEGILTGSIEHSSSGESLDFFGLMNMLEAIEDKLNESGFPQAAMALRNWVLPDTSALEEMPGLDAVSFPEIVYGKSLASFILRIQFRQNASWQGSLSWIEGKTAIAFRSVLELVKLINSAVQYACEQNMVIVVTKPEHRWKARESVS